MHDMHKLGAIRQSTIASIAQEYPNGPVGRHIMGMRTLALLTTAIAAVVALWTPGFAIAATLTGTVEIWEPSGKKAVKLDSHRNAVVFVTGFSEPPPTGRRAALAQKNKAFTQRVLVITQGEVVEFPNHDPIFHNVWSRSPAKIFDLGLYKHPETKPVQFLKPGIVTVFCNIHAHMIASILVLPNNKVAKTDASGRFRIEGIPAGKRTVYAWVEGAKPVKRKATFSDGKPLQMKFKLLLRRIPISHFNKEGRPYRKYRR